MTIPKALVHLNGIYENNTHSIRVRVTKILQGYVEPNPPEEPLIYFKNYLSYTTYCLRQDYFLSEYPNLVGKEEWKK